MKINSYTNGRSCFPGKNGGLRIKDAIRLLYNTILSRTYRMNDDSTDHLVISVAIIRAPGKHSKEYVIFRDIKRSRFYITYAYDDNVDSIVNDIYDLNNTTDLILFKRYIKIKTRYIIKLGMIGVWRLV